MKARHGGLLGWQPATPDEGLQAARELQAKGFATAVVKLGAKGVAFPGPKSEGFVPPFKVTADRYGGRRRQFQWRPCLRPR